MGKIIEKIENDLKEIKGPEVQISKKTKRAFKDQDDIRAKMAKKVFLG